MDLDAARLSHGKAARRRLIFFELILAAATSLRSSSPECAYNTPDLGDDSWMFDRYSAR
jgi:hypothetical protein